MIYSIENEFYRIYVSSLGATLNRFFVKTINKDIVLGFDKEEDYINNKGLFFGATVGRTCNRTKNAEFILNNIKYHLEKNDGNNNLHSGDGVSFSNFKLVEQINNKLSFNIFLEDGRDGFPGNLELTVNYILEGKKLIIEFIGLADKDTIFNITNHSYFNLSGAEEDVLGHRIKIYTDKVALNDKDNLATDEVFNVSNSSFDFIDYKLLQDNIDLQHPNLSGGGIDHNFIFENLNMKKLISVKYNDIILNISSDLPGLQMYSSNFIDNIKGKDGKYYNKFWGLALEPQFYPNAINYSKFLKPIVKANNQIKHIIEYEIVREE